MGIIKKMGAFLKKHLKLIVVLVIIVVVILVLRYRAQKAAEAMLEQANTPVTATVSVMDLQQSVSVTGSLAAADTAAVTSTIGGSVTGVKVSKINYEVGDYVEAGDGGHTAQAHGRAGTQVARVRHDVQAGNLTLQGLVGRGERQTFHALHVEGLRGSGHLLLLNHQAAGVVSAAHHLHFLELCVLRVEFHLEHRLVANGDDLGLVAHVGEHQLVLCALDLHGEVAVEVGLGGRHDTVVGVAFHHVTHHHGAFVVRQRSRDAHSLCHEAVEGGGHQGCQYDFL